MDIETHLIECRGDNGTHYFVETEAGQTFQRAADLIRKGEYDRVTRVLRFNPAEDTCNDVTGDVALEIAALVRTEGFLSRAAMEFIDHYDMEIGNTVRWAA